MKNLIQYISIGFILFSVFSCSNDFLNVDLENLNIGNSSVFISPEWEAKEYAVFCQNVGNAKFTVKSAPSWLKISSESGQFTNDVAFISCSATVNGAFSDIGIYLDQMILSVENKGDYTVSVSYVTEGNPVIEAEKNLTINYYNTYNNLITVQNSGNGILLWEIAEYPQWLSINQVGELVLPQNATGTVSVFYNPGVPFPDDLEGKIVLTSNDKNNKEIIVNVRCNLGDPVLNCYQNQLNFGRTETTQSLEISNQGNGLLVWKIENCPEWLSVSETNGTLSNWSWKTLTFTCNRALMPDGQHTQTIYLKTNDKNNPSYAITVTGRNNITNPENIKAIEGTVTDAWLDKKTDILYLATGQPNRLLAYNTKTKTIDGTLSLDKTPTCFSISEDGRNAVIGHGGLISYVDMDNFSVIKTMDINYNIYDIEWGKDNWFCYTPGAEIQHYNLLWRNVDTGKEYETPYGNSLFGGTLIKKIPNQAYIVASRLRLSPSGITVFDINTRNSSNYFHEEMGRFWFSEDGDYVFNSHRNIYRTSMLIQADNISPIGTFSPSPYQVYWIDHHAATRSVWVLSSSIDYYFDTQREIMQYEDNDYKRVKTYYYSDYYVFNGTEYPVQAQYVFANKAGSELIAVRNIAENYGINAWSLEHIPVER